LLAKHLILDFFSALGNACFFKLCAAYFICNIRPIDWAQSEYWFERAADEGGTEDDPPYQLTARLAEMLTIGGPGLPKDPQRAGKFHSNLSTQKYSFSKK
jgi:TPR repeat protein